MSNSIKLVSLNIEMNRHLDKILPFLEQEQPDVLCLQEVLERDFPIFSKRLDMQGRFEPAALLGSPRFGESSRGLPFGLAVFSRFLAQYDVDCYSGNQSSLPLCVIGYEGNRVIVRATFLANGKTYHIGTTHFTWTPDGNASDEQRRDMKALLAVLRALPHVVLCGDFNAPRGGEMWNELARNVTDNIPKEYTSSLDPKLHRAAPLERMVDGLFSTPEYRVSEVRLVEGISDHKAVVGFIERL